MAACDLSSAWGKAGPVLAMGTVAVRSKLGVFLLPCRTALAKVCGLIWPSSASSQLSELKHLLKSELALSHWALTRRSKLSPCLIALP